MSLKKVNHGEMKTQNRRMLLESIIANQPVHRAQLSDLTRLNKVTVSSLVA